MQEAGGICTSMPKETWNPVYLSITPTRISGSARLLEALKSPIFMAYHNGQPFNKNMLRPCPMLENPEKLRAMVKETNANSTDYESPEEVGRTL